MRVRRSVAAGLVGLALVIGASGCGKITEKVAEEAIERNSDCSDVDIDAEGGGFTGSCGGDDIDISASGDASLPDAWPGELAPPDGFKITASNTTSNPVSLTVIGSLDGDIDSVFEGLKSQLTSAGYTIDQDSLTDVGSGKAGTIQATGPDYTASVGVSEADNALDGNISVTYTLNEA